LELFLNPFAMMLGGLLVSAPIVIHLINRMRFKRVRWAAMEFLLKSQQRNRRKMIIEQLILLLLRILLVLLAGLLLARFLGFSALDSVDAQRTLHYVILDDTPSMSDFWKEDGETKDAFEVGKKLVHEKIGKLAAQAGSPQFMEVLLLSDLANPRPFERLNSTTLDEIRSWLNPLKPSSKHVDLLDGLKKVVERSENEKNTRFMIHLVTDFRNIDWAGENETRLKEKFEELKTAGIQLFLIDVAHPESGESTEKPLHHDNLAILDLRPETRLAPKNSMIEFLVNVANYSNAARKNVPVVVRLNGSERAESSFNLPDLPPNQITTARFTMNFDRTASRENPLDAFNLVSVHLEPEVSGLSVDNTRYAYVEVREKVPLLLIESKASALKQERGRFIPASKDAECFYLYKLFTETIKGFDVAVVPATEIEKISLKSFISIYSCGVPRFTETAVKALEEYVRSGGGLAIFLGPELRAADTTFYNERLYQNGSGLYPAPIESRPLNDGLADDKIQPTRWARRLSGVPQIYPRDKQHPALESLYIDDRVRTRDSGLDALLKFVVIERYFPVNRVVWKADPGTVQELMTLPNLKPMATYEGQLRVFLERLATILENDKFADYRNSLQTQATELKRLAASNEPLLTLARRLDEFLTDPGDKEKKIPSMQLFWQFPELLELGREIQGLLATIKFGDPLYLAKTFGTGRVIGSTSSAGNAWNDLEGLSVSHYPPLMLSFQRYLASASTDMNLSIGSTFEFRFPASRYQPKAKLWQVIQEDNANKGKESLTIQVNSRGEQTLPTKNQEKKDESFHELSFSNGNIPGIYLFEFTENAVLQPGQIGEATTLPQLQALAYNLDSLREGNLERVDRGTIREVAGKDAKLVNANTIDEIEDTLKERRNDLSESPWMYLFFLLILIGEQAMAVRLSYHSADATNRGNTDH
jgi:hypothetical protein